MNKAYIAGIGIIVLAIIGFGIYVSIGNQKTTSELQVATSFYPLYFFASQIAGNKADVVNITPSGAEPHDYEPTAKDIADIENSRMLVVNGNLEPWAASVRQNLDKNRTLVVIAGEGL